MTPEQAENREERIAIMIHDGGLTEDEAQMYCDSKPEQYGIRETKLTQASLF